MASPVTLNAFAAVFAVRDVGVSLGFFLGRLEFREHFRLAIRRLMPLSSATPSRSI